MNRIFEVLSILIRHAYDEMDGLRRPHRQLHGVSTRASELLRQHGSHFIRASREHHRILRGGGLVCNMSPRVPDVESDGDNLAALDVHVLQQFLLSHGNGEACLSMSEDISAVLGKGRPCIKGMVRNLVIYIQTTQERHD